MFLFVFLTVMFVYSLAGTFGTDLKLLLTQYFNVPALKLVVLSLEASHFCVVSCLLDPIKYVREEKSNSAPSQTNRLAECNVTWLFTYSDILSPG